MKQFKRQITATVGAILIALALIGVNADQAIAQGKVRKGAKARAGSNAKGRMSTLQNSENVSSNAQRKNAAGAEAFSIDIGTSENVKLQTERARERSRKRTRQ
jgi:hypothetical protein